MKTWVNAQWWKDFDFRLERFGYWRVNGIECRTDEDLLAAVPDLEPRPVAPSSPSPVAPGARPTR